MTTDDLVPFVQMHYTDKLEYTADILDKLSHGKKQQITDVFTGPHCELWHVFQYMSRQ